MMIMKRLTRWALVLALPLGLLACAAPPTPSDYAAQKPVLDLAQYFNGTIIAHGIFTDRDGRVQKRFTVRMECQWTGDAGVLDESFDYADGTKSRRVWRLKKLPALHGRGR